MTGAGEQHERERFDEDRQYERFRDLMRHHIREILLVSSPYDSYTLEQDGMLSESLDAEYHELRLSAAPRITQVSTGGEALEALERIPFDLVITTARLGGMDLRAFGRAVKRTRPDLAVVLLAYNPTEAARVKEMIASTRARGEDPPPVDQVFIWHGDVRILLAIVKHFEDQRNVERDTELAGVRAILLVENSVRFVSSYLPLLYTELVKQNQRLMADGVNARQRLRRMKARPKILLAETFEEGWALFERYRDTLLGILLDCGFCKDGKEDPDAGLEFLRRVKQAEPDMPVLMQSSEIANAPLARALDADFLDKESPYLLEELRSFMRRSLGFGDFVFQLPDGTEVARARDLQEMGRVLRGVPEEALRYHASRNHFSNWCMARTEFDLAARIRPVKVSQFESIADLRRYLIDAFERLRTDARRGVISDFSRSDGEEATGFARIGSGSLGGKGRGLGFLDALLARSDLPRQFPGVRIQVPAAVAIGTDVFDDFLLDNGLRALALDEEDDEAIASAFESGKFRVPIEEDLRAFLRRFRCPIAVRSSSLLEDSPDQPFAGIYRTIMLPNDEASEEERLANLMRAIRAVYASTYSREAKSYIRQTQHRMEEEKMGVVLQRLIGRRRRGGPRFYPSLAGVARSTNSYPVLGGRAEDGVALVALGFGKTVVDGERSIRFSPGSPRCLPQFGSAEETLENAQRTFYALRCGSGGPAHVRTGEEWLERLDLEAAEEDGALRHVGSVYSPDDDTIHDGISRQGIRIVTFASILKRETFPLAPILERLLQMGARAMSGPIEIEFAAELPAEPAATAEFGVLQIRPVSIEAGSTDLDEILDRTPPGRRLCVSTRAIGQGRIRGISDVVFVHPDRFDRSRTPAIASDVGSLDEALRAEGREYLLIGPGRWGTSDPWLGIPVAWHQISGVRAILETDLLDVPVAPSEGTHFFQNMTSFGIAYLNVASREPADFLDLHWLASLPWRREAGCVRHVRLPQPLDLWIDGRSRRGVILKSELES